MRLPERYILVKATTNFEKWTRKRRNIAPRHRNIGWGPLLIVNKLYYAEMIYEFYANLHKGRVQKQGSITYQWVTSRVDGRDISFDDRMLNSILGTPKNKLVIILVLEKIYNKHTFKRMGFSRNEEGMLVRVGQEDNDEKEEYEGQDAMNVDEKVSEEKPEKETFRREMR
ncbi:hypothetical protein M9H77_04652 [Catharanthus roseus]|uniref:Uncharacterized protein n=1 Tax=Catharanthus roseus TaxID=4058 RepID=A0ACC0CEV9_CATRO|nr:hypothetical protein M9H77_04652 [Catharanthus roseus]